MDAVLRSLVLAIATALLLVRFVLVAEWEEQKLRARLGEPNEAYRRATPQFVPRLSRRQGRG